MSVPTPGRIVQFMTENFEIRPAIIVRATKDKVSLSVFTEYGNLRWIEEAPYSEEPKALHWSWPTRN